MSSRLWTRSLLTTRHLSSALSRSCTSFSTYSSLSSISRFPLLVFRPLFAVSANLRNLSPSVTTIRGLATRQASSSLNYSNPNWSNRPPKETILLDGCDFEHWLVVMEKPDDNMTRDEIIDSYIKTLAVVVGSEKEARTKIYSVSTKHCFAFGVLVSEELSSKLRELPKVRSVVRDSCSLDNKNKNSGGEPFISGQAVPYKPKYHEEQVRNNTQANERNKRNGRPRTADRSRNFERGENMMRNLGMPNSGPNMVGVLNTENMPSNNLGVAPSMGGVPPNCVGGMSPSNSMQVVIRSFSNPYFPKHSWPYMREIGLPQSRTLYTVLRSPHIDKKSREQFEMRINSKLLAIKTETHDLRKRFFWLKRLRIFGAQYTILFSCKTRLDLGKVKIESGTENEEVI